VFVERDETNHDEPGRRLINTDKREVGREGKKDMGLLRAGKERRFASTDTNTMDRNRMIITLSASPRQQSPNRPHPLPARPLVSVITIAQRFMRVLLSKVWVDSKGSTVCRLIVEAWRIVIDS
jgi:hypothetical protein